MSVHNFILLESSLCKDCGSCCFNCGNLGQNGCVDDEYRLNSRCASFPILYGTPKEMGYHDIEAIEEDLEGRKRWFISTFNQCAILNNERLYQYLRWVMFDLQKNGKKLMFFHAGFEKNTLSLFILD